MTPQYFYKMYYRVVRFEKKKFNVAKAVELN